MYYKILEKVFQQDDLYVSRETINLLDAFIRQELEHGFSYLNPYKFSNFSNIPIKESIQIFLFYTNENYLFHPRLLVDCPYCVGEAILIEEDNEFLYCEECRRELSPEKLKEKIYVLFKLNDSIEIPRMKMEFLNYNPNSTFEILQNTPETLKKDYPLSSKKESEDRGNRGYPSYSEVEKVNLKDEEPISNSFNNLTHAMFSEGLV